MKSKLVMTVLRMLIGWHFLYEGLWKLVQPFKILAAGALQPKDSFPFASAPGRVPPCAALLSGVARGLRTRHAPDIAPDCKWSSQKLKCCLIRACPCDTGDGVIIFW